VPFAALLLLPAKTIEQDSGRAAASKNGSVCLQGKFTRYIAQFVHTLWLAVLNGTDQTATCFNILLFFAFMQNHTWKIETKLKPCYSVPHGANTLARPSN